MKFPCAALLLACCVIVGGCATQSSQTAAFRPDQNVVLKPGDTISICDLAGDTSSDEPSITVQINDDGSVTLPLVGAIEIAGLTTTQAATKFRDAYVPKYYQREQLVFVVRKVPQAKRQKSSSSAF